MTNINKLLKLVALIFQWKQHRECKTVADTLTFFGGGGQRPHESQSTVRTTNKFVLYPLKSEIIGGAAVLPQMSYTDAKDHWYKIFILS